MANGIEMMSPVGRLVQGSVDSLEPVTDNYGKPKLGKDGQPMKSCFFAVAFPKTAADWKSEPWASAIIQAANTGSYGANALNRPDFAWKVVDGDSSIPDKKGNLPKNKVGFPGNWVLRFSGGFLPTLLVRDGSSKLPEGQVISPGDYCQVLFDAAPNNSIQTPGVYLNHKAVAFSGHGERITYDRDYTASGFGQAPMPAGVMATPSAGVAAGPAPVAAPAVVPVATPAAPLPVPPNPAVLQPPVPAPVRQMTAAATHTYEQYVASGWTDAMLVQHGLMVA